jgi:nitroimidazol reductase NimA-like FMN-containing flavoprotein (pyridoxamine 5'-phosphate oxidase superfamily)
MLFGVKLLSQNWAEYVKNQPVLRIATVDDNCIPHVTPVWFVFDGSVFYMAFEKSTRKLNNIKKNKNVSLVIDSYDQYNWDKVTGITFNGIAEVLKISDETKKAKKLLKQKYPYYATKYADWLDGGRSKPSAVIVKVTPSRYLFWTD